MRRLFSISFAALIISASFVPSSANAGPLQRLLGRLRSDTNSAVYYSNATVDASRRYSYEPGMDSPTVTRSYQTHRNYETRKPNWWYPKADPRRYGSY